MCIMIHTTHNANTQKECNPLYYIVNRKQSNLYHSGSLFNKWKFKGKDANKEMKVVICPEEQTESVELLR